MCQTIGMTLDIERHMVARLAGMTPSERERALEQQSAFVADWLAVRARWIDRYVMTCSAQGAGGDPDAIASKAACAFETRGHEDAREAAAASMAGRF